MRVRRLLWVIPSLALLACGVFLVTHYRQHPSRASTPPQFETDPDAQEMSSALLSLGYKDEAFIGVDWRAPSCSQHSYIVMLGEQPSILFTRDVKTGDVEALPTSEAERQLRRHISFDGGFVGLRLSPDGINEYWWLGVVPDEKDRRDIYVHFDKGACGFVVDKVWYRGPSGNDQTVPVSIRLEPIPNWKLNQ